MQDAKNANGLSTHKIGGEIGCACNDEFACAGNAAGAAAFRKVAEPTCRDRNPFVDSNGRGRILAFNMREVVIAIGEREGRPNESHVFRLPALRAAARRAAKCAST